MYYSFCTNIGVDTTIYTLGLSGCSRFIALPKYWCRNHENTADRLHIPPLFIEFQMFSVNEYTYNITEKFISEIV